MYMFTRLIIVSVSFTSAFLYSCIYVRSLINYIYYYQKLVFHLFVYY